jgi:hypothetical protein
MGKRLGFERRRIAIGLRGKPRRRTASKGGE